MKSGRPQIKRFDRNIDNDGRLRLPEYVFDEYGQIIISLGIHGKYLQLMDDGMWAIVELTFDSADFKDIENFRLQRRLSTRARIRMDKQRRIMIPLDLLKASGIEPGSAVVGIKIVVKGGSYWALYSRSEFDNTDISRSVKHSLN